MNLTEIKPNDLLRDGMVHCTMLFFFDFAGGSGGLDNIASDPLDSAKSFLQMSDLFTGPPRSPKGPAIMTGSAMTLKLKHYAFCDQSWRRMK